VVLETDDGFSCSVIELPAVLLICVNADYELLVSYF
jgi:hypothetical protein